MRVATSAVLVLSLQAAQAATKSPLADVQVTLVSSKAVNQVNPTYASWNIDSSCNRGFHRIDFSNPNLLAAAKALWPSTLRFGGSGNDNLIYGLTPGSPECKSVPPTPTDCAYVTQGCLNASHWDKLYGLAKNSETDFLFGLAFNLQEACAQQRNFTWSSANAQALLDYIGQNKQEVWGFELGNEINNNQNSPCNLVPKQQSAAMVLFHSVLQKSSFSSSSKLLGPDTGYLNPQQWLQSYLESTHNANVPLHSVTHHVYTGISRGDFNDPATLDRDLPEIAWYADIARRYAPGAQIWAGEDGPIGGGNTGTCGDASTSVCGTFASSVWYADNMALRAKHGFVQFQRQDLIGAWYGLVNSKSAQQQGPFLNQSEPIVLRPDFWVNFLWKRTLGTTVLNATSSSANLRAYAFSGPPASKFAPHECVEGRLQLLLINLDNSSQVTAQLPAVSGSTSYSQWALQPGESQQHVPKPFSKIAKLNSVGLHVDVDVAVLDPSKYLEDVPVAPVKQPISTNCYM